MGASRASARSVEAYEGDVQGVVFRQRGRRCVDKQLEAGRRGVVVGAALAENQSRGETTQRDRLELDSRRRGVADVIVMDAAMPVAPRCDKYGKLYVRGRRQVCAICGVRRIIHSVPSGSCRGCRALPRKYAVAHRATSTRVGGRAAERSTLRSLRGLFSGRQRPPALTRASSTASPQRTAVVSFY